eukprot:scaffold149_cov315-Pinguiococcus_pyrenoidosus.AAC.151
MDARKKQGGTRAKRLPTLDAMQERAGWFLQGLLANWRHARTPARTPARSNHSTLLAGTLF